MKEINCHSNNKEILDPNQTNQIKQISHLFQPKKLNLEMFRHVRKNEVKTDIDIQVKAPLQQEMVLGGNLEEKIYNKNIFFEDFNPENIITE